MAVLIGRERGVLLALSKLLHLSARARLIRKAMNNAAQVAARARPQTREAIPPGLIPFLFLWSISLEG